MRNMSELIQEIRFHNKLWKYLQDEVEKSPEAQQCKGCLSTTLDAIEHGRRPGKQNRYCGVGSELVQVKKQKTFEEVCPEWNEFLKHESELTHNKKLDISVINRCIVGEAHGFTGGYYTECKICHKYSQEDFMHALAFRSQQPYLIHEAIEGFMKHWNEKHVK